MGLRTCGSRLPRIGFHAGRTGTTKGSFLKWAKDMGRAHLGFWIFVEIGPYGPQLVLAPPPVGILILCLDQTFQSQSDILRRGHIIQENNST